MPTEKTPLVLLGLVPLPAAVPLPVAEGVGGAVEVAFPVVEADVDDAAVVEALVEAADLDTHL